MEESTQVELHGKPLRPYPLLRNVFSLYLVVSRNSREPSSLSGQFRPNCFRRTVNVLASMADLQGNFVAHV